MHMDLSKTLNKVGAISGLLVTNFLLCRLHDH